MWEWVDVSVPLLISYKQVGVCVQYNFMTLQCYSRVYAFPPLFLKLNSD